MITYAVTVGEKHMGSCVYGRGVYGEAFAQRELASVTGLGLSDSIAMSLARKTISEPETYRLQ